MSEAQLMKFRSAVMSDPVRDLWLDVRSITVVRPHHNAPATLVVLSLGSERFVIRGPLNDVASAIHDFQEGLRRGARYPQGWSYLEWKYEEDIKAEEADRVQSEGSKPIV